MISANLNSIAVNRKGALINLESIY